MTSKFEESIARFVALCDVPGGVRRKDLPPADRYTDMVRQAARRRGLVVYENRGDGFRWFATRKEAPDAGN